MLGMSYVQIAREGLGYQKSQTGGGTIPKAGAVDSTYHRYGSLVSVQDKEKFVLRRNRYFADRNRQPGAWRQGGFSACLV